MEFYIYLLIILAVLTSIPLGILLRYLADDELKKARRLFRVLELVLIGLSFFLFLYYIKAGFSIFIGVGLVLSIIILFMLISKRTKLNFIIRQGLIILLAVSSFFIDEISLFIIPLILFILNLISISVENVVFSKSWFRKEKH